MDGVEVGVQLPQYSRQFCEKLDDSLYHKMKNHDYQTNIWEKLKLVNTPSPTEIFYHYFSLFLLLFAFVDTYLLKIAIPVIINTEITINKQLMLA